MRGFLPDGPGYGPVLIVPDPENNGQKVTGR
jgi:hypothetical protein